MHLLSGGYRSTNSRSVQETRFERECFGEQKEAEGPDGELGLVRASAGNADKALNARRNPSEGVSSSPTDFPRMASRAWLERFTSAPVVQDRPRGARAALPPDYPC